jgi:hypothetical protein
LRWASAMILRAAALIFLRGRSVDTGVGRTPPAPQKRTRGVRLSEHQYRASALQIQVWRQLSLLL